MINDGNITTDALNGKIVRNGTRDVVDAWVKKWLNDQATSRFSNAFEKRSIRFTRIIFIAFFKSIQKLWLYSVLFLTINELTTLRLSSHLKTEISSLSNVLKDISTPRAVFCWSLRWRGDVASFQTIVKLRKNRFNEVHSFDFQELIWLSLFQ